MHSMIALANWHGQNWGGHPWAGGAFHPWMLLVPLLFWGGFVALIVWAVVRLFPKSSAGNYQAVPRDRAEEILRERFARGEINIEEYERSLKILRREADREPRD